MCNLVFISSETEQPTVVRQLRLLNNFKKYIELLENFNFMGFIFHANLNEYLIMYLLHKKDRFNFLCVEILKHNQKRKHPISKQLRTILILCKLAKFK